jgi:hypothetical protein
VKPASLSTAPLTTFPIPHKLCEKIALNFVGPLPMTLRHQDFLLDLSCHLTKFAKAIPCSQKIDKHQLAETLFNEVFCCYGIPLVIVSDRDPRLDKAFFSQLASLQGTSQRLTTGTGTAHCPQGNGQAEALIKEFMTKLKAYFYDTSLSADWDTFVAHLCCAYNTTPFLLIGIHLLHICAVLAILLFIVLMVILHSFCCMVTILILLIVCMFLP